MDATNALSVSLCHHYLKSHNAGVSGGKSGGKFLAENPERLGASTGKKKAATKG